MRKSLGPTRRDNTICCTAGMLLVLCFCSSIQAATLPERADDVHLGVASCASGVCHGSVRERSTTRILQNEFVVWSKRERHRNAYNILLSEDSKRIASNLGLANAHEAAVCLDCHADNVAQSRRGKRFQISDGIGCEACHGGAARYVSSHTDPSQSHQDNIDNGLYPADRLEERAALCFSCHIGNEDKIASHEIMGAGHPRLAFELDTFSILQPAHYLLDEDYKAEKWSADSMIIWALGQIETAYQTLRLLETYLDKQQLFPELSLFDCHACHHAMSDQRWQAQERVRLPPGTVRLNDAGFVMLFPIARSLTTVPVVELERNLRALHSAVTENGDVALAAASLRSTLDTLKRSIDQLAPHGNVLLDDILGMGARGEFKDYVAAEQAVMAVDMLLSSTQDGRRNDEWLDRLYEVVEDENTYDAAKFADLLNALLVPEPTRQSSPVGGSSQ